MARLSTEERKINIRVIVLEWRLSNYAFSLKARGNKAVEFVKTIFPKKLKAVK